MFVCTQEHPVSRYGRVRRVKEGLRRVGNWSEQTVVRKHYIGIRSFGFEDVVDNLSTMFSFSSLAHMLVLS
jgi:hypothetical protein